MYFSKVPSAFKFFFPDIIWRMATEQRKLYLSFDDGPDPEITPRVLDLLKAHDAKATFFCIGKNVEAHPELYQRIIDEGHMIGNHSYSHQSGWKMDTDSYLKDVKKAAGLIYSKLYRPPYGQIKPSQYKALKKDYEIVMWDVMPGDFDAKISKEQCLNLVKEKTKNGSIIVLHDSPVAKEKLEYVLPRVLEYYGERGFSFDGVKL